MPEAAAVTRLLRRATADETEQRTSRLFFLAAVEWGGGGKTSEERMQWRRAGPLLFVPPECSVSHSGCVCVCLWGLGHGCAYAIMHPTSRS